MSDLKKLEIVIKQGERAGLYRIRAARALPWPVTVGAVDLPQSINTPETLRLIAAALVRKAEEIERENAVLRKPQPAGVKAGPMNI